MTDNTPTGHDGDDDFRPAVPGSDRDDTQAFPESTEHPTEAFPATTEHPTDQYTAPYPTVDRTASTPGAADDDDATDAAVGRPSGADQASASTEAPASGQQSQYGRPTEHPDATASSYGQQPSADGYGHQAATGHQGRSGEQPQYGQQGQYDQRAGNGQQAGNGQYGQYGAGQQPYGQQDQYGQQHQYGQASPYGAQQPPYGEHAGTQHGGYGQGAQQHGGYGQGAQQHGGYGQYGQYGQSAQQPASTGAPTSTQAPTSAFGDLDGRSPNGHYFTDGAAAPAGTTTERRSNGRRFVIPAAALVIGALVGGAAGGGWVAATGNGGSGTTTTSQSSQSGGNLTVNDYNSATVVTAVAAKATPSVVTINVSASNEAGTGSGVVLSKDGYIVTNTHVVTLDGDSANGTIQVTTSDGKIYSGKLVGTDPTVDLAVIKIDAQGLTPMSFADSSKLNVGDTAVAIGAPLGLSNTVTDGIVSTLNRSIQVTSSAPSQGGDSNEGGGNNGNGPYDFWGNGDNGSSSGSGSTVSLPVIQTDASINPGNSGGALLDSKGKLIGINVAIASASSSSSSSDSQSGSIGVGFSIPANLVKRVSQEIIDNGSATHGLLGATVGDAAQEANATQMGAAIKSVTSGGAAAKAGLQKGDVVTKIGDASVADATDLTAQVRYFAGGAKTQITYVRDGQTHTSDVTLGTYKS